MIFCYWGTTGNMVLNYSAALGAMSNAKIKINFCQLLDWIQQQGGKNHTFISFVCCKMCLGNDLKKDYYNQNLAAGWLSMEWQINVNVSHGIVLRFKKWESLWGLDFLCSLSEGDFLAQVLNENQCKIHICRFYLQNPQE